MTTVIAGANLAGIGDTRDARAPIAFSTGSIYSIPAHLSHVRTVLVVETTSREIGTGPNRNTPLSTAPPS